MDESRPASVTDTRPLNLANIPREIARCTDPTGLNGFRYWLAKYVRIEGPASGGVPFEMWPCHVEAINALATERLLIVLKARQIGMSWLFGATYPLWLAMFHPSTTCLLFSRSEADAYELIRKCRYTWERLPSWMQVPLSGQSQTRLEFEGLDSRLLAFSSHPDAGSGYTARYALADEHSKQIYAEEQFSAVRPTVAAGGQFVSVSTAKGTGNFFHTLWRGTKHGTASAGENGFKPLFFPYNVRPGRTPEWWEAERSTYPREPEFYQDYPRDPDEAFQSSVPRVMDPKHLRLLASCQKPLDVKALCREQPKVYGDLLPLVPIVARRGELGFCLYQTWKKEQSYVLGADVSEGFNGGDAQAAVVLCRETGEEVAVLHGRWPVPQYARYLDALAQYFHINPVAIERNNHGHGLILQLQALMVQRLKLKEPGQRPTYQLYHDKPVLDSLGQVVRPQKPGWLTTPRTKPLLFTGLQEAFAEDDIRLASELILDELRMLQLDDKGHIGAPHDWHDDLAVAVAIAWRMILSTQRPRARPRIPVAMGQHTREMVANYDAQQSGRDSIIERLRGGPKPTTGVSTRQGTGRRSSFLGRQRLGWESGVAVPAGFGKVWDRR